MKKIAIRTAVILATITVLVLLWEFREAVILFFLSLGVAATARPLVDFLVARGVRRSVSILSVYFVTIALAILLIVAAGGPLINDLQNLSNVFASAYHDVWVNWPQGTQLEQAIAAQLPPPQDLYGAISGAQGTAALQSVLGFTLSTFTLISQFFAILILSIYWSIDRVHFERLWLSLLPVDSRSRAREVWRNIEAGVGAYIRSELIQSILAGILLAIAFSLLRLDFPILLALFCALAWLVPWLGAVFAVIPVFLIGSLGGVSTGLAGSAVTILVLLGMELFVEPRVFNRRSFNSLLIVLFILAFADLLGLIGVIIAPPLAAAVQILFHNLFTAEPQPYAIGSVKQIADLGEKIEEIHALLNNLPDPPSPQSVNMLERLDHLVEKAQEIDSGDFTVSLPANGAAISK